ncbi:MAG: undecaprenyl-diphosphate phosphatase [Nitrospirae bacterium]|nr:undecaprenyl-diphosphate phosphatase [Nitrospirota bacterium]
MFEAIILGIVQGLTEFMPVSSTAHLVFLPELFGWHGAVDSMAFDVALHFGTTLALLVFFWQDWMEILLKNRRMLWLILAGSVPAGVLGLLFRKVIEESFRTPALMAAMLILFGGVMYVAEKFGGRKTLSDLGLPDAVTVGMAQALALVPGVSRSGATISAGLFMGYSRPAAARFSFLLSTPAICGATLLESKHIMHGLDAEMSIFATGFVTSLLAGWGALLFLMRYLERHPVNVFVYYRLAFAALIIVTLWQKG